MTRPEGIAAMLQGSLTALATPFTREGIDDAMVARAVDRQIRAGAGGLVPCGAMGEAPTLTAGERDRMIRLCVDRAAGAVPVIAGTGASGTAATIDRTRAARAAGADAALIVTPFYNRPSQEGLYRHFAAVAAAVDLPIILDNAPKRTGVDLHFSTVERLARIPSIVGIRDGSGDVDRPRVTALVAGAAFLQLCGDDAGAVTFNLAGGRGCISSVANVAPALCRDLHRACRAKDWPAARALQHRLKPLLDALAREPGPGAVKRALALLHPGFSPEPRLPLVGVSAGTAAAIEEALVGLGLLAGDAASPSVRIA